MNLVSTQVISDYINEESDELLLKMVENIEKDGFALEGSDEPELETIGILIVSQTMVKFLSLLSDKQNIPIGESYLNLLPLHGDLIKHYEKVEKA